MVINCDNDISVYHVLQVQEEKMRIPRRNGRIGCDRVVAPVPAVQCALPAPAAVSFVSSLSGWWCSQRWSWPQPAPHQRPPPPRPPSRLPPRLPPLLTRSARRRRPCQRPRRTAEPRARRTWPLATILPTNKWSCRSGSRRAPDRSARARAHRGVPRSARAPPTIPIIIFIIKQKMI